MIEAAKTQDSFLTIHFCGFVPSWPKTFVALIYLSGMEAFGDPSMLATITTMKMPFGKYKGRVLCELPVEYLEWFARKGFPPGKMGMLLSTVYEIKLNGLEYLLAPIKKLDKR